MRFSIGLIAMGVTLLLLVASPFIQSVVSSEEPVAKYSTNIVNELDKLDLLNNLSEKDVASLLDYQEQQGKNLAQTLRDPFWRKKLGLEGNQYKATWYMANPFELLPEDLQVAIKNKEIPFRSRTHVWEWCRQNRVSKRWRKALYAALIETTPHNLWRASRGYRPITRNGQFLQPIVIDHGNGVLEVQDGHIATDPRVIPTNSEVLLIVTINGVDRVLKVKAADTGGAIKGMHVDLPIHVGPDAKPMPYTLLPAKKIGNPTVEILTPIPA